MDHPLTFRNASGDALAGVLSEPEKPDGRAVVLLHCFTCTKHHRILRNLSRSLSGHGITVLRFDFSGNGESGGKLEESTYTKMIGDVGEAVSLLLDRGARKVGVGGHSMGAMISALSAHEDRRIAAVGFIAGSSQAARVREIFPAEVLEKVERDGASEAFVYGRNIILRKEFLLDVERYNIGHAVATLGRPLLVVHGTADETIPVYHARQVYAWASEPKRLELIRDADHMFRKDEHLRLMTDTVSSWFAQALR
jgi:esterase/lipase